MRIRTFIALVCAVTILVIGFGLNEAVRKTLGRESETLERLHNRSVAEFAKSVIEGRVFLLSAFRENLDSGNRIAKAFLMGRNAARASELRDLLEALRHRTNCDVVEIEDFGGTTKILSPEIFATLTDVQSGRSKFLIAGLKGRPTLLSISPLRLFGEPVGAAVLGFYLDGDAVREIRSATGAEVKLVAISEKPEQGVTDISVRAEGHAIGSVGLLVSGGPVANVSRDTQSAIFRTGAVCFFLVLVVLFGLLEFGFLRRFKGVLRDITESSAELSRGRILSYSARKHPIQEVTDLSDAFATHLIELQAFQERVESKSRTEALGEVTAQVAHDLKGLLSTIEMTLDLDHEANFSSQKKASLKRLLARVHGITATVVERLRRKHDVDSFSMSDESLSVEPVYALVDAIVAEKAYQYGERPFLRIEFQPSEGCHELFVSVQPTEFKRIVANLIDNAVQSIEEEGEVCVLLLGDAVSVRLQVTDTGRGIPASLLPRLFERGASFGKANGLGLGLWHARSALREWRGEIALSTDEGHGTSVELKLPRIEPSSRASNRRPA